MAYLFLPIAAFLGAILVLIPLPSHWRARNYATISLVAWMFIVNVIYGINSAVWHDNVRIMLLVWCDITTKLTIGASIALPATAMCICKHLESVASGRVVRVNHGDKQRRMYFELGMCFLLPAIIMALHYVVQGHRFDIVEAFGCQPATYYSIPGVFIVWFPPLLLASISMVYAFVALYHFVRHRVMFAAVLQSASSSITPNRYLRLMALAVTQVVWQVTLTVIPMYENVVFGLRPWTTWADVHSDWLRVDQYTLAEFMPAFRRQLFFFFLVMPASSLLFFLFFGFGEQAMKDYRQAADWIRHRVFRRPSRSQRIADKGMILNSNVTLPSPSPYSIPCFVSNDSSLLPAYSPPADLSQFASAFKSKPKKDLGDLQLDNLSLDDVTIPTIRSRELSLIDSVSSRSSECSSSHHSAEQHVAVPIVARRFAPESPPLQHPTGLRPPPLIHVSRFSADSDIAHVA